jgi:hypothetical protein
MHRLTDSFAITEGVLFSALMRATHRQLVKLSALEVAAASVKSFELPAEGGSASSGQIRVWIADASHRFASAAPIPWRAPVRHCSRKCHRPQTDTKFQPIPGFGGAFTEATCYALSQLSAATREQLFHELFHPPQMGLNVCRTCVGAK